MPYLSGGLFYQNKFPVRSQSVLSFATCVLLFNRCVCPCPLHVIYITFTTSMHAEAVVRKNVLQNRCSEKFPSGLHLY